MVEAAGVKPAQDIENLKLLIANEAKRARKARKAIRLYKLRDAFLMLQVMPPEELHCARSKQHQNFAMSVTPPINNRPPSARQRFMGW
jgi:hypothetical protein